MLQSTFPCLNSSNNQIKLNFCNRLDLRISKKVVCLFTLLGCALAFTFLSIPYALLINCFLLFSLRTFYKKDDVKEMPTIDDVKEMPTIKVSNTSKVSNPEIDPIDESYKIAKESVKTFKKQHSSIKDTQIKILQIKDIPKKPPAGISFLEVPTEAKHHRIFIITKKMCPFQKIMGRK